MDFLIHGSNVNLELHRLKIQAAVLKDVAMDYPGRTIENIIANVEARIKAMEVRQ